MKKPLHFTYFHGSDTIGEGPFLQEQIRGMADAGLIKADAKIFDNNKQEYGLEYFYDDDEAAGVRLQGVDLDVGQACLVLIRWSLAAIPAGIVVSVIVWVLLLFFGIVAPGLASRF